MTTQTQFVPGTLYKELKAIAKLADVPVDHVIRIVLAGAVNAWKKTPSKKKKGEV